MSKKIKVIKCPQCGSASSTQIKEDYYKCDNCNTQFYLDSDDININVRYQEDSRPRKEPDLKKAKILLITMISIVFIVLTWVVSSVFNGSSNKNFNYPAFGNIRLDFPIDIDGKIYLLTIADSYEKEQDPFYSLIDFESKKIKESKKLKGAGSLGSSIQDVNLFNFSNGEIYIVVHEQRVFKLDRGNMEFIDVTQSLFEKDPIYQSGIAKVSYYFERRFGDSFNVMTNLGRQYYYYPRINKSFENENITDTIRTREISKSESTKAVAYEFTKKKFSSMKMELKDETQLLKILYWNDGGPLTTTFTPLWIDDFRTKTIELKMDYLSKMSSYKNLTPGRLYFNPKIFYADEDYLLLTVTTTASEKSQRSLQRINTTTGELMWSIPLNLERDRYRNYLNRSIHAGNKFALKINDNTEYLIVSDDGKDVQYFTLRD